MKKMYHDMIDSYLITKHHISRVFAIYHMNSFSKLTLTILVMLLILNYAKFPNFVFSQNNKINVNPIVNSTWISKRDNLNITMSLTPPMPIIDQTTKINFEVKKLDNQSFLNNASAKITITDQDGRLYKFENKFFPIINGKVSMDYLFPVEGEHEVILRLYNNSMPFTVSSFNIIIPQSIPKDNNLISNLFGNLFH
ncbi:hypothetical protein [Candidatus Nitrosocosmicus oleophilus]|nr:hypothetical protein [Candidatus Nitrosocosmicus oleophilus]